MEKKKNLFVNCPTKTVFFPYLFDSSLGLDYKIIFNVSSFKENGAFQKSFRKNLT